MAESKTSATEYAQQYNGQNVVAVRSVNPSDAGYSADDCENQVVATLADGTTVTLNKDQIKSGDPTQGTQSAQQQPPKQGQPGSHPSNQAQQGSREGGPSFRPTGKKE